MRERVAKVYVLLPQSAFSAATLLALGADEIVMHPNSHLGPVDMQITTFAGGEPRQFSTEDISAFLEFVRESLSITDQKHLRSLFELTCREVGSLGVGFTARSAKLAVALGEKLLAMHQKDGDQGATKRRSIVENLSRQFHSHAYPVSRHEAIEMGVSVNKERDRELESLMWAVWLDLEEELKERQPFDVIAELLNSDQAATLLAPAPQLHMPSYPAPSYVTADWQSLVAPATLVQPVPFELVTAILESSRLAHRGVTRGKILASRQPDLKLQFNCLLTFVGWEHAPT